MKKLIKSLVLLFLLISFYLFYFASQNFIGQKFYYLIFTFSSFFSILFSFRKNGFFLEKFLSIYLWLGFWLKFTLFQGFFMNNPPASGFGNFESTPDNLNELMILSSLPFISLTISSFCLSKVNFFQSSIKNEYLPKLYQKFRGIILSSSVLLIILVSITNFYFGIYQKGLITKVDLPFFISGFYKWFYLMGSGVILSLFIKFELDNKKDISNRLYLIVLFESFISNFTLLSRAMIFNISSIFYGIYESLRLRKIYKKQYLKIVFYYFLTIVLFLTLVPIVNKVRDELYFSENKLALEQSEIFNKSEINLEKKTLKVFERNQISNNSIYSNSSISKVVQLIYIRFVGIESLMAVYSYDDLNFQNFKEAFKEEIDYSNYNHYFLKYNLLEKNNSNEIFMVEKKNLKNEQYTIHIPGIVAFLFYSGSKVFLFISIFILSIIFYSLERFVYYSSSGNLVLTAFISHIISYRLAHFGYVPTQSYLFFGALLITIFAIFLLNKFLK